MGNSALRSAVSDAALGLSDLEKYAAGWLLACEIRPCSAATLATRRLFLRNLSWFLKQRECASCGVMELRLFFAYLTNGHKEPGGRWGNARQTKPVKPRTLKDYHGALRTFFRWVVDEGGLPSSPMDRIPVPIDRSDAIQPFSDAQIEDLITAARKGRHPKRDEAILLFLLDTGVRAGELCGLRFRDLDMSGKKATVEGKGGKSRPVYFGKRTARALWAYLREDGREPDDPVFHSERADGLTRYGLSQLIDRLGRAANVTGVRCSAHTFRHSFSVAFLRAGGNQMSLMALLGHTNVQMTSRYVHLSQADCERAHRQFSPGDSLKGRGK